MKDYIKFKKLQELKELIGNYDDFGLSLKDLKKMRTVKASGCTLLHHDKHFKLIAKKLDISSIDFLS